MKEDKSVPEMFHRLQVLVNDQDKDFSHKFWDAYP
jgi:hypothetical protein